MSSRTTAVVGRAGRPLAVLLALLVGAFAVLWPARMTTGVPLVPALVDSAEEAGSQGGIHDPVLAAPICLTAANQHQPGGCPLENPWQDTGMSSLPGIQRSMSVFTAPLVSRSVQEGAAPPPQPRGPPQPSAPR